jgi:hypothetical protein
MDDEGIDDDVYRMPEGWFSTWNSDGTETYHGGKNGPIASSQPPITLSS